MAPKADAKAKADAKKKQPKKEKTEEEEKNKVQPPDAEAHQAALQVIQDAIDKIQKKMAEYSAEIKGRSGGKDEFFEKKAVIRSELDEIQEKINALQNKKEDIQKTIGDKRTEQIAMKGELNKMKKSMAYGSEVEIDERIAKIESTLLHDSLTLKEEKKCLAEIQELKRNKPKVSQVAGMQEKLSSFDPGLSMKEQNKQISADINELRDKRKEIQEKLKAIQEERQKQLGDLPDIIKKREELGKEIAAKIQERNELKDKFNAEKQAFNAYLAEQREARRAKYEEERKARQMEWKKESLRREIEKMDEQPHLDEITLIEQTIKFCKGLLPQDATATKEEKKEIVHNNKDNETVLRKKEDRDEEFYFAPTKGKKAKKSKAASGDASAKPIKHNAETFKLFEKLKLDAPITTAEIPALLEALDAQMEDYLAKVKKWEEEKEEKKRILLEGGTLPEDEAEEEAKEEEAGAEEEEAEAEEEEADKEDEEKEEDKEDEEKEEE